MSGPPPNVIDVILTKLKKTTYLYNNINKKNKQAIKLHLKLFLSQTNLNKFQTVSKQTDKFLFHFFALYGFIAGILEIRES